MAIIGSLIKGAIHLKDALTPNVEPISAQVEVQSGITNQQ